MEEIGEERRKTKYLLHLQNNYGVNLLDAEECRSIYEKLLKRKNEIIEKFRISNENYLAGEVHVNSRNICNQLKSISERSAKMIDDIESDLDNVGEIKRKFRLHSDNLDNLVTLKCYAQIFQKMEYFNTELEREYKHGDCERCVTLFANLCDISWNLTNLKKSHLHCKLMDLLKYWHEILKTKLSKDFEEVLKIINWPFVNANFSLQTPPQGALEKLKLLTEYLLQIELPRETNEEDAILPINTSHLSLPISLLIQPFKKRFIYHFHGARQTNRSDKPEWYFTQVLTWIRDHEEYIQNWIQPIVDKLGYYHIDGKVEFIVGLVQLATEKLQSEIPNVQSDDVTFSHTIDEALSFDKELRDVYNYPSIQSGILRVLTQAAVFIKWISMEKKFAIEKMDNILSFTIMDPFAPLPSDVDDLKVTVCADAFMTLLKRITDRYESLPQPGHRLQFLELQLELLDDFRVRLIQIANVEEGNVIESRVPMILNTLFYIENVLNDWGNMLHYLNLYYYKKQLENVKTTPQFLPELGDPLTGYASENVFAELLSVYGHMRQDLLFTLSECVINEVKTKSKNYRRETWSQMKGNKGFNSLSLTPSACPMFEILAMRLHQLQKSLGTKLFSIAWKSVAQQIDSFLFEDLVLDNRFSESGALQLKFDIQRNLFPLFSQYTDKPNFYFVQLSESINLLNLARGSAILLKDLLMQLEDATGVEDTRGHMLQEVGVTNFTPKMAVTILNHRADLHPERLIID